MEVKIDIKMEKRNKTFALGDAHGNYKALLQCIERSNIDRLNDTLIVLGDVVDGYPYVKEVVEELLTFKKLIPIRGNHDQWFMNWAKDKLPNEAWTNQGGMATLESYNYDEKLIARHMEEYFNKSVYYYLDDKKNLFVHGGINWHETLEENDLDNMTWDRHAYQVAVGWENFALAHPDRKKNYFKDYNKVFVGHTTTQYKIGWNYKPSTLPVFATNLINLDTGAGFSGKLTLMNIDTEEYFQSDLVTELYPKEFNKRRNG